MYTEERISFGEAAPLLKKCGLIPVDNADYRVGIFNADEDLVATGALVGGMLQMIAVDPDYQGEDLSAKVVTHLIGEAARRGLFCVYLITKGSAVPSFLGMGFRPVGIVPGEVGLLEWGSPGIREYTESLEKLRDPAARKVGCLVMNGNPFTLGHRFLIRQAAAACDRVFVLVVEEDLSEFPFDVRLELFRRGTADLENVTVLPGGRYAISSLTFPAYFSRDAARAGLQSRLDAEIFVRHIAPALGVTDRFLGEEPFSPSTAIYNQAVEERLSKAGIGVHILPRLAADGTAVSATRVRQLIREGRLPETKSLLPATTYDYLTEHREEAEAWVSKTR